MATIFKRLKGLFSSQPAKTLSEAETAQLSNTFKTRYHHFKLLLAANNNSLELMAEMESALAGNRIFGMSFIRARCTALGVSVYAMVKNLEGLAPGKYQELFERHRAIQWDIDHVLSKGPLPSEGELVLSMGEVDKLWADQVGGKMANLGEVANRLGLPTPPGFVITAAAQHRFFGHNHLQEEINRRIQATVLGRTDQLFMLSSSIQQLITKAEVPPDLEQAIDEAYRNLEEQTHPEVTVSLRSSALGEDASQVSFAGQYSSQLNVRQEHMLDAYREVMASKYSPQAMRYRYVRGLRDEDLPMCVGCLAMVDAAVGGVAYSTNPMNIRDDNVHITSAWGLPKGVVDGDAPVDLFVVSRSEPLELVEQKIVRKDSRFDCFPDEGVCRLVTTGEQAEMPTLSQEQAREVARHALLLEEHYGAPQDVEWCLDQERNLVILQCRPLMQVKPAEQPAPAEGMAAGVLASGGVAVSPGAASGPVFWVKKDSDALRFPAGAVLVVDQTWPRWAALLGPAVAVVAQKGNLAGHLATVAREYAVPALFGLGDAAQALADGQVVTVDAEGMTVYEGRVESLLERQAPRLNLMTDSPVYQYLKQVLQKITPLTMLDPDSPNFRPLSCQTLHDITRFCHEKSVHEMFNFGKRHSFPQRSAKQLHYHVPMQYWVINLDDGFVQEVSGKYVRMDNIACIPMLALWEGIIAVPWDGPPAISGKGLASVMFQATANPELASPFKAPMAEGNYFMISKNFMNLQARYGFHFSTVEALVSERDRENYLSFSFSGGAADTQRRIGRVQFIAELLEARGFTVEIREDVLRSRVDSLGGDEMKTRLRLMGYLLMHTRQLDMIMANPAQVERYRAKFRQDMDMIIAAEPPAEPE